MIVVDIHCGLVVVVGSRCGLVLVVGSRNVMEECSGYLVGFPFFFDSSGFRIS